jgi:hypothetical protein
MLQLTPQPQAVFSMGDKSPKAKDKSKKQDQKKAAANVKKPTAASTPPAKKGK